MIQLAPGLTPSVLALHRAELEELKPRLIVKSVQSEEMMAAMLVDRREADAKREVVAEEEKLSSAKAAEARELQLQCEKELQAAMPALNAAMEAVKELSKADVSEVKALKNPPVRDTPRQPSTMQRHMLPRPRYNAHAIDREQLLAAAMTTRAAHACAIE